MDWLMFFGFDWIEFVDWFVEYVEYVVEGCWIDGY